MFVATRLAAPSLRIVWRFGRVGRGAGVAIIQSEAGLGRPHQELWRSSSNDATTTTTTSTITTGTTLEEEVPSSSVPKNGENVEQQEQQQVHLPRQHCRVVDDKDDEASRLFLNAVEASMGSSSSPSSSSDTASSAARVVVTLRGDKISRLGMIELASIYFEGRKSVGEEGDGESLAAPTSTTAENPVFMVDFRHDGVNAAERSPKHIERINAFQTLLESDRVQKVMHDSRMPCDALWHVYGFRMANIHDTSCFHQVETGEIEAPLNTILRHNNLQENPNRGNRFYRENPTLWQTRPLTDDLMQWGAMGVAKMLALADRQAATMQDKGLYQHALVKSAEFASSLAEMELQYGIRCRLDPKDFIGVGGVNIRKLRDETGTSVYQGNDTPRTWSVYYRTKDNLNAVLRAMGYQ
jgi:hypothetical protein